MLTTWDRRRADVVDVALQAGFPQTDAEVLAVASRPAARLVARSDRAPELGASKLGGLPDLAPDAGWPRGRHGLMTFLGQVATAQVAFLDGIEGWRPAGALLSFFADKDPESDQVTAGVVLATDVWVSGDMDPRVDGRVMLSNEDEDVDDTDHPFRLLAQFTTDHDAGIELADAGGIYFVARADDLAAGRYDRLAVVMQSH